jgi:LysR family transcriptional regulator, cell division regulator
VNLVELVTFASVARAGTLTQAAEELHTVQSNVTARIRLLEAEVGAPLFYRHARGVTLTSAGERLLPYAQRISHLLSEARECLREDAEPCGPLRVGSLESTAGYRLPAVLRDYCVRWPQVDVALQTGTSAELIDAVLAYRLEGALVVGPVQHPELLAEPMIREELVIVASPSWPGLEALTAGCSVRSLVLRRGCSYRERLERLLAARGVHTTVQEFGTLDAIVGCAGAGIGISLLPRAVVTGAVERGLVALHALPEADACAQTVFIRRADSYVSPALRCFIECCQSAFASAGDIRSHHKD